MRFTDQPPYDARKTRILLVGQDDDVRRSLQLQLNGWGFEVRSFASPALALADPSSISADVLLVDGQLATGDVGANSVLQDMRRQGWRGRAILMSAAAEDLRNGVAGHAGFAAVIRNPPRNVELLGALGAMTRA